MLKKLALVLLRYVASGAVYALPGCEAASEAATDTVGAATPSSSGAAATVVDAEVCVDPAGLAAAVEAAVPPFLASSMDSEIVCA